MSTVAFVYFVDMPLAQRIAEQRGLDDWSYWSDGYRLFALLMHSSIPVCAVFHAFKRSYLALCVIVIWCGLVSFFLIVQLLIGVTFEGHPFIAVTVFNLALITLVFALVNTRVTLPLPEEGQ